MLVLCRTVHPEIGQGWSYHQKAGGRSLESTRPRQHGGEAKRETLWPRKEERYRQRPHA